jgi:hypothetical protein
MAFQALGGGLQFQGTFLSRRQQQFHNHGDRSDQEQGADDLA